MVRSISERTHSVECGFEWTSPEAETPGTVLW